MTTEPYTSGALTPPTCPTCGTNEYVERDTMGGQGRPGSPHHNPHERVWLCTGQCWTVFRGSQLEWEQMRDRRESRAKARAARGQGPHRGPAPEVTP